MKPSFSVTGLVCTVGLSWFIGLGLAGGHEPAFVPDPNTTKFPIAGTDYDEAVAIYQGQRVQLERLPGVHGSALGPDGIIVYTEDPTALPAEIGGIPVSAGPPIFPRIAGRSFQEVEAIVERNRQVLEQLPDVESIGVGPEGIVVHTANPDVLPLSIEGIPVYARRSWGNPINGISYVNARKIFQEYEKELLNLPGVQGGNLGFDGIHLYTSEPDALPKEVEGLPVLAKAPLYEPIVGIPFEEAQDIFKRHQKLLEQTPGVQAVFLGPYGIAVYTDQPELVPDQLEDLPITTFPPMPGGEILSKGESVQ